MNKIWYFLIIVGLIAGSALWWHRSSSYAVGFFMPVDHGNQTANVMLFRGLYETWQLGIDDAKATNKFNITIAEIPADTDESMPVLKQLVKDFLGQHPRWRWQDEKLLIVAGYLSKHLKAAQEVVQQAGRNCICVSPSSTTPQAASWKNVLQVVHNDNFAAQAVVMFIRRKQYDKVAILYIPHDAYSQGYSDELSKTLTQQEIAYKAIAYVPDSIVNVIDQSVNPYLKDARNPVLFFAGFSSDIIKAEKVLDLRVSLLCSDGCSDLGDIFPPQRAVIVVVPSIIDYTITSRDVYKKLFKILEQKISDFDYVVSYAVPFMYDFAYQVGNMIIERFDLQWRYFAFKIDAAKPGAALDSTWYTPKRNGPAHGGYWFLYTHDAQSINMVNYRKMSLGNTYQLPQSAAAAYQIGYYSWAGLLGWNMYQNIWENYYIHDKLLARKLSYENQQAGDGIINWAPFHVKKYQDGRGKWWFASDLVDQYPIEERVYHLS